MTQRTDSAPTSTRRYRLRSLLLKSMSCISIVSLFSSNLALAQTEAAIDPLPLSGVTAPTINQPRVSPARWQRLKQKLRSPLAKRQQHRVAVTASPTIIRQARPSSKVYTSSIPHTKATKVRSVVKRHNNLSSSLDYNGAYIDPTGYKIGATTGYEAPRSVVLSERSTGCKAVVRSVLSSSICRTAARPTRVARLTRPNAGLLSRNRIATRTGIRPIQVGPLNISASGFRVTTHPETKRSILTYYNRNSQPYGQSGSINANFMFPLTIPAPITSLFGWRIHPITGDQRFHAGTDLGAPLGTPVLAVHPGTVETADYLGGYGLTVVLNHNKLTQQTLYAHLSEVFVEPGERIEQGTVIGRVGSTGNSTGPHLHFETRQLTPEGWVVMDPGIQLEYAMAQLVRALQSAQSQGVRDKG